MDECKLFSVTYHERLWLSRKKNDDELMMMMMMMIIMMIMMATSLTGTEAE